MHAAFQVKEGSFQFATSKDASDTEEILAFLNDSIKDSCEGLMVKRLDSMYEPSTKRWDSWLKLKKDYVDGMGDSLDLVPIGGWRGQGRKGKWISPWLVATYDPRDGTLGSVCRVMSGSGLTNLIPVSGCRDQQSPNARLMFRNGRSTISPVTFWRFIWMLQSAFRRGKPTLESTGPRAPPYT